MAFATDNWSGVVAATISEYVKGAWPNVTRRRKLLNMLQTNNRITFGHTGTQLEWLIEFNRQKLQGFGNASTISFSRHDRYQRAKLDWRGYALSDALYEKDLLQNKGDQALVNLYSTIATNLMKDCEQDLGTQFYIDGQATGNELRFHGIETFMNTGSGTSSAASPVVTPVGVNYAGLATDLGAVGGFWPVNGASVSIWPESEGDVSYDYMTPLIVDYTSANVTTPASGIVGFGGTADWKTRAQEALRYGIIHSRVGDAAEDMLTIGMLATDLYRDFLNTQDAKERIVTVRQDSPSGLRGMGYMGDVFNFEGVDFTWESAVPRGVGYGFNANQMELCSLYGGLMESYGPVRDMATMAYQFALAMFGNCRYNPRRFVKWMAFS